MKLPSVDADQETSSSTDGSRESSPQVDQVSGGDELDGSMDRSPDEQRLAHTVLDVDKDNISDGMLIDEAFNQNMKSFLPEMMFKDLVSDYKNAERLYGQTMIRELSGYDPRFIDKNIKIPEFQRELEKRINDKFEDLQEKGLMKKSGMFSKDAIDTAALFLIDEEYEKTKNAFSQFGEVVHTVSNKSGEKTDTRPFLRRDSYRDLAVKKSIAKAIRRGHDTIAADDLVAYDREARQQINIVYALDTSGSMKGEKLRLAKKAGVSLAHRAIKDQNKVGLVLFGSSVGNQVPLTKDFFTFVKPLTMSSPGQETDIGLAIKSATRLLTDAKGVKHVVLLTDCLHTKGGYNDVLEQVLIAKEQNISISVVGINLDEQGQDLSHQIVDIANGKLFAVKNADELGGVVIADYASLL